MKFLLNLLTEAGTSPGGGGQTNNNGWVMWVILIGLCVVMFVLSSRSRKKQQQQIVHRLSALKPGDRISTIGLIQGVIEEIYEDGIILISTGSEDKKSYLTIERNAIYRTIPEIEPIPEEQEQPEVNENIENGENVEQAIEEIESSEN